MFRGDRVSVLEDETFCKWMVVIAHNCVNVLSATDLYTQKWIRGYILWYVYFTTILKKEQKKEDPC